MKLFISAKLETLYGFIVHANLIAFVLKQDEKYEKKPEICFTEIYNPMRIL